MEKIVIQINGGITIDFHVGVKNVRHVKKIMFEMLLHVIVKMESIQHSILDDSPIICGEVIDADAKLSPKDDDKTKTIAKNFNEKKGIYKMQNTYLHFYYLLQHY